MRKRVVRCAAVAIVLLPSCGGSAAASPERFRKACEDSSNMPPAVCECLSRKAETELSDTERAFVIAGLEQDQERAAELRGELGLAGAMRAGMFMTSAGACALEANGGSRSR